MLLTQSGSVPSVERSLFALPPCGGSSEDPSVNSTQYPPVSLAKLTGLDVKSSVAICVFTPSLTISSLRYAVFATHAPRNRVPRTNSAQSPSPRSVAKDAVGSW